MYLFFFAAGGSDFRNQQQHYFSWTLELSYKVLAQSIHYKNYLAIYIVYQNQNIKSRNNAYRFYRLTGCVLETSIVRRAESKSGCFFFVFRFGFSFLYNTIKQTSIQFRFSFCCIVQKLSLQLIIYKCNQLIKYYNIGLIHIQIIFRYTLSLIVYACIQTTIFTTLGVKKLFSKASLISSFELTNGKVVDAFNCLELILLQLGAKILYKKQLT